MQKEVKDIREIGMPEKITKKLVERGITLEVLRRLSYRELSELINANFKNTQETMDACARCGIFFPGMPTGYISKAVARTCPPPKGEGDNIGVCELPVAEAVKNKLMKSGYFTLGDLRGISILKLYQINSLGRKSADNLISCIRDLTGEPETFFKSA